MNILRLLPLLWLLGLSGSLAARTAGSPGDVAAVFAARDELGGRGWAMAVVIENTAPGSPYPSSTCALVFEFMDALWFYCPTDGTQSLSRLRHHVEEDRARLLELLQTVEPGFGAWRELTAQDLAAAPRARRPLPNGCFIESLGEARRKEAQGDPAEARLLSIYFGTRGGLHGHTVLCLDSPEGTRVFDPVGRRTRWLPAGGRRLPAKELARSMLPAPLAALVVKALILPVARQA